MVTERIVKARILCSVPPPDGMSDDMYWRPECREHRVPKETFRAFLLARLALYKAMAAQHNLPLTEGTYGEGYEDWYIYAPISALTPFVDDLLALGFREPSFVLYVPATEEGLSFVERYQGKLPMEPDEDFGEESEATEEEFDRYSERMWSL